MESIINLRFPEKLWKIISICQTDSISWNDDGSSVLIYYPKFEKEFMREGKGFFKTNKISSFVRQLNLYGFVKFRGRESSNSKPNIHEFHHNFFIRSREDLLCFVSRNHIGYKKEDQRRRPRQVNTQPCRGGKRNVRKRPTKRAKVRKTLSPVPVEDELEEYDKILNLPHQSEESELDLVSLVMNDDDEDIDGKSKLDRTLDILEESQDEDQNVVPQIEQNWNCDLVAALQEEEPIISQTSAMTPMLTNTSSMNFWTPLRTPIVGKKLAQNRDASTSLVCSTPFLNHGKKPSIADFSPIMATDYGKTAWNTAVVPRPSPANARPTLLTATKIIQTTSLMSPSTQVGSPFLIPNSQEKIVLKKEMISKSSSPWASPYLTPRGIEIRAPPRHLNRQGHTPIQMPSPSPRVMPQTPIAVPNRQATFNGTPTSNCTISSDMLVSHTKRKTFWECLRQQPSSSQRSMVPFSAGPSRSRSTTPNLVNISKQNIARVQSMKSISNMDTDTLDVTPATPKNHRSFSAEHITNSGSATFGLGSHGGLNAGRPNSAIFNDGCQKGGQESYMSMDSEQHRQSGSRFSDVPMALENGEDKNDTGYFSTPSMSYVYPETPSISSSRYVAPKVARVKPQPARFSTPLPSLGKPWNYDKNWNQYNTPDYASLERHHNGGVVNCLTTPRCKQVAKSASALVMQARLMKTKAGKNSQFDAPQQNGKQNGKDDEPLRDDKEHRNDGNDSDTSSASSPVSVTNYRRPKARNGKKNVKRLHDDKNYYPSGGLKMTRPLVGEGSSDHTYYYQMESCGFYKVLRSGRFVSYQDMKTNRKRRQKVTSEVKESKTIELQRDIMYETSKPTPKEAEPKPTVEKTPKVAFNKDPVLETPKVSMLSKIGMSKTPSVKNFQKVMKEIDTIFSKEMQQNLPKFIVDAFDSFKETLPEDDEVNDSEEKTIEEVQMQTKADKSSIDGENAIRSPSSSLPTVEHYNSVESTSSPASYGKGKPDIFDVPELVIDEGNTIDSNTLMNGEDNGISGGKTMSSTADAHGKVGNSNKGALYIPELTTEEEKLLIDAIDAMDEDTKPYCDRVLKEEGYLENFFNYGVSLPSS